MSSAASRKGSIESSWTNVGSIDQAALRSI